VAPPDDGIGLAGSHSQADILAAADPNDSNGGRHFPGGPMPVLDKDAKQTD